MCYPQSHASRYQAPTNPSIRPIPDVFNLHAAQDTDETVMLPATRGAAVLYINVVRPALGNIKSKTSNSSSTSSTGSNPFQKDGFSAAGTTAPSSFERESCFVPPPCKLHTHSKERGVCDLARGIGEYWCLSIMTSEMLDPLVLKPRSRSGA